MRGALLVACVYATLTLAATSGAADAVDVSTIPTYGVTFPVTTNYTEAPHHHEHERTEAPAATDDVQMWGLDRSKSVLLRSMICVCLVLLAGTVSGLTLSVFSIGVEELEGLKRSTDSATRACAKRLLSIAKHEHWVLVTLLVCNAAAVEALPLMMDPLLPSMVVGIVVSTLLVLIFGEILPQSIFVKFAFPISGRLVYFIWLMMCVTAPISWTIAKLLDIVIGHRSVRFLRRTELREMVFLNLQLRQRKVEGPEADALLSHSRSRTFGGDDDVDERPVFRPSQAPFVDDGLDQPPTQAMKRRSTVGSSQYDFADQPPAENEGILSVDEAKMMVGALSIAEKRVGSVMRPITEIFWLREDTRLTPDVIELIVTSGFSRIPVATTASTQNQSGPLSSKEEEALTNYDALVPSGSFGTPSRLSMARQSAPQRGPGPLNSRTPPTAAGAVQLESYFLTKDLLMLMHEEPGAELKTPHDFTLYPPAECVVEDTLLDIYEQFVSGRAHLAVVRASHASDARAVGIVTYSDVIAVITQTHFHDETDLANALPMQFRMKKVAAEYHGLHGHNTARKQQSSSWRDPRRSANTRGSGARPITISLARAPDSRSSVGAVSPAAQRLSISPAPTMSYGATDHMEARSPCIPQHMPTPHR
jgi:CBS domain containing-hemolysin-like protein